ncbi:MAG: cation:proton antiporter, partial [Deltaproteobacteria bacterium]|nr:cation:proton antiporter [Deltaproteobacteria bacterium]
MTGVAVSGRGQAQSVAQEVLRLAVIAAGMVIGGSWVVPRWMHLASRLNSQEVLLVTASGLCFAFAAVASHLGYSVALGAFIAGMLVAESGLAHRVEGLIGPLRDVFASIFFVSIGMTVDLRRLIEMSPAVILVAFVVIIAQSLVVTSMGLISGVGLRPALIGGLLLGQVGEFSFILASLGRSMHMVRRDLPTLLVGVSVLTVFTTPLLARASDRIVRFVDRHLPAPLRHLLVLYDQWVAALRVQYRESQNNRVRKALRALLFDGLLVVGLFAGIAKISRPVTRWVAVELSIRKAYVHVVWVALAFVLVVGPVLWSMMRTTHALVDAVFERQGEDRRHTRALRQAFRALLLVGMALLVGFPAVTLFGAEFKSQKVLWAMALFMAALVFSTWRSAKAAGEEIQSAALSLARFLMASPPSSERASTPFLPPHLPVLGNLHSVVVQPSWACVGRSLGELNLRALTDVAVLAIQRGEKVITLPRGEEVLLAHDLLLITGTDDSVEQGIHLLRGDSQSQARGAFCANLDGILEAKEKNEYTGLSDG